MGLALALYLYIPYIPRPYTFYKQSISHQAVRREVNVILLVC